MSPEVITAPINKADLTADFSLQLKLVPPHFSRKYGFVITISKGQRTDEIKYETEVTYLKTIHPNTRLFKIDRISPVYINGLEPDLLAEQMAYEAGKVFYPLIIEADFTGAFIRINNYQEITNRWAIKKTELQDYFEGEPAEKYIQLMDSAIADKNQLNKAIRNDWFINLYFSGIYKSYSLALKITDTMGFPLVGLATPAQYVTLQEVSEQLNEYNGVEVYHRGTLSDDRSMIDLEQELDFALSKIEHPELPPVKGNYDGLYVLEPDTKAIESAIINIGLELTETKNFNLKLFRIDDEKVKAPVKPMAKGEAQLVIIDGLAAGREKQANVFSKFMDSLFGK